MTAARKHQYVHRFNLQYQPRQGRDEPLMGCDKWATIGEDLSRAAIIERLTGATIDRRNPGKLPRHLQDDENFYRVVPTFRSLTLAEATTSDIDEAESVQT